jgi:soluble calcium-activated nucleotidase 1
MRAALGFSHPGYLLHETGIWNPFSRKWIFLPRRASKEPYDDALDEARGTNYLIEASENFDSFDHVRVGVREPSLSMPCCDPRRVSL